MAGQSKKKLNRLMEKAEELFFKYGYSGVSVDQIAAEAGISKMTLYKYFHSKEDLFVEVLIRMTDYHNTIIMEKLGENYHAIEKFKFLYTYLIQLVNQLPPILTKDVLEHTGIFEKIKAYKEKIALDMWRYILEDGIKKGEIRQMDVGFASELLLRLPVAFMNTEYFSDEMKIKKFLENLFDFMKYGLLGGMENQQCVAGKEGVYDAEKHTDES